jgi:hypothetical protein
MSATNLDREREAIHFSSADLRKVVKALNIDEKIALLAGADWWTTVPVPRLVRYLQRISVVEKHAESDCLRTQGVPAVKCSDGPNGVRWVYCHIAFSFGTEDWF